MYLSILNYTYLSIRLSIYLSIYLSIIYLSIYLPMYLSVIFLLALFLWRKPCGSSEIVYI